MVTIFGIAFVVCVLFLLVYEESGFGFLGFIFGLAIGFLVALWIGNSIPTKTIVIKNEPIEQITFISNEEGVFFLQKDEENEKYLYMVNGGVRMLDVCEVDDLDFESDTAPFIEFSRIEPALTKGQGWKMIFGLTNLPREEIVIHLPQGSIYFIQPEK